MRLKLHDTAFYDVIGTEMREELHFILGEIYVVL